MDSLCGMVKIEDVNEFNKFDLVSLMIEYFDFYEVKHPGRDNLLQLVDKIMDSGEDRQFLANVDGEYAGFVTLYSVFSTLSASKIILMNDLFVTKRFRRRGIGKSLFQHSLEYTRSLEYPKMEWFTEPSNEKARAFYDYNGGVSSEWIFYAYNLRD